MCAEEKQTVRTTCDRIRLLLLYALPNTLAWQDAAEALIRMGIRDRDVKDFLMRATKRRARSVFFIMCRNGYFDPDFAPIARCVLSEEPDNGDWAALFLGGLRNKEDIPFLISVARKRSTPPNVRYAIVQALGDIGVPDPAVIEFLRQVITNRNRKFLGTKVMAIVVLARLGFETEAFLYLQHLIDASRETGLRMHLASEWIKMNREDLAYAYLHDVIKNYQQYAEKGWLFSILLEFGSLRKYKNEIVPFLRQVVADGSVNVQEGALRALAQLGAKDEETVSTYRRALHDSNWHVRMAALRALVLLEIATPEDVAKLGRCPCGWETMLYALLDIDRKHLSRVGGAIVDLLKDVPPHAEIIARRLRIHVGVVHDDDLDALENALKKGGEVEQVNAARALEDLWYALRCQASESFWACF